MTPLCTLHHSANRLPLFTVWSFLSGQIFSTKIRSISYGSRRSCSREKSYSWNFSWHCPIKKLKRRYSIYLECLTYLDQLDFIWSCMVGTVQRTFLLDILPHTFVRTPLSYITLTYTTKLCIVPTSQTPLGRILYLYHRATL